MKGSLERSLNSGSLQEQLQASEAPKEAAGIERVGLRSRNLEGTREGSLERSLNSGKFLAPNIHGIDFFCKKLVFNVFFGARASELMLARRSGISRSLAELWTYNRIAE